MYSTRGALALLWRGATTSPDGAILWSAEEQATATVLRERRLADIITTVRQRDGKAEELQILHLTHEGAMLWEAVLDLVEARVLRDGE